MTAPIQKPIPYVNRSTVQLHTTEAVALLHGKGLYKDHPKIPSFYSFGKKLNHIWNQARDDNPYAEYALIQIEHQLDITFKKLALFEKLLKRNKAQWDLPEGVIIVDCEAIEPACITLNGAAFNTPHAKLLLILIAKFDSLMRTLKSYRQFNIIRNRRFHNVKRRAIRSIRACMHEARSYRASHVTRRDILEQTDAGVAAVTQFGIVSLAILKHQERSQYGPHPIAWPAI